MINKNYTELSRLTKFIDRFEYLKLGGTVGHETFGFNRHLNQAFYTSSAWRNVRRHVILRDAGCDLGISGYEIHSNLLVHHMIPMTTDDIINEEPWILDPEYLITTCDDTHNAIHFGDSSLLKVEFVERVPGDTRLW